MCPFELATSRGVVLCCVPSNGVLALMPCIANNNRTISRYPRLHAIYNGVHRRSPRFGSICATDMFRDAAKRHTLCPLLCVRCVMSVGFEKMQSAPLHVQPGPRVCVQCRIYLMYRYVVPVTHGDGCVRASLVAIIGFKQMKVNSSALKHTHHYNSCDRPCTCTTT